MSTPLRTSPESDHRRQPRKKRVPSGRDQAIVVAYRTQGRSQAELAKDYQLSQSRVSAIIRRVEKWLAVGCISEAQCTEAAAKGAFHAPYDESTHAQRLRFDRWLERERAQAIYHRAIRGFDTSPQELTTIKEGHRDGKPFHEEVRRHQPPSAQMLRIALGASNDLGRLAEREPIAEAETQDKAERRQVVEQWLGDMRHDAARAGKVVGDPNDHAVIRDLVKSVVGEPNEGFWEMYQKHDKKLHTRRLAQAERQDSMNSVAGVDSVPGSSLGPQDREAPASPDAAPVAESTVDAAEGGPSGYCVPREDPGHENGGPSSASGGLVPPYEDAASNCFNCTNPTTAESTETEAMPKLPIQNPKSKIENQNNSASANTDQPSTTDDAAELEEAAAKMKDYVAKLRSEQSDNSRELLEYYEREPRS